MLFRSADMGWRDLLAIVGLNAAGHLFFDSINSFGVQLLWPLSWVRPELAITFILDFALTGILAAPHLTIFPGLAIALLVLGFNFLGDGLRDRYDPKQQR